MWRKPVAVIFRVWVCAFFVSSLFTSVFDGFAMAAKTYPKIKAEVRTDTTMERSGQQIPLQDPPLLYKDKFYISVKSLDSILNTYTVWNKKRNVLEVMESTPQPLSNNTGASGSKPKSTPKPDANSSGSKPNASSNGSNQSANNNVIKLKSTPTPRGFKASSTPFVVRVTPTPVAFLFLTPTPFNNVSNENSNSSGTNGNSNGNNNGGSNGGNNGGNVKGNSSGGNGQVIVTPTPKFPKINNTPRPTPKRNVAPVTIGSPAPIAPTRLVNYSIEYMGNKYDVVANLYKDSLYFRYRDLLKMDVDWSGVPIFKEPLTNEDFIMREELVNRLLETPMVLLLKTPVLTGIDDPDKRNCLNAFIGNGSKFGVGLSDSSSPILWVSPTSVENEYKAISQNGVTGKITEYGVKLMKSDTGYTASTTTIKSLN